MLYSASSVVHLVSLARLAIGRATAVAQCSVVAGFYRQHQDSESMLFEQSVLVLYSLQVGELGGIDWAIRFVRIVEVHLFVKRIWLLALDQRLEE